jgi:hypothetical protein
MATTKTEMPPNPCAASWVLHAAARARKYDFIVTATENKKRRNMLDQANIQLVTRDEIMNYPQELALE